MENQPPHRLASATHGALVVISWGEPIHVKRQVARLGLDFDRILVIAPFPEDQSACPHVGFDAHPAVRWLEVTPAEASGQVEMLRYAHPHFLSRTRATQELADVFPNLVERDRVQVVAMGPDDLEAQIAALPDPLHLVIDTPGGEAAILAVLARGSLLGRAVSLSVRCGTAMFFEDGALAEDVVQLLEAGSFEQVAARDADPDWPELSFRPDPNAWRHASLKRALVEAKTACNTHLAETQRLTLALAQAQDQIARLSGQLDMTTGALEAERASVAALQATAAQVQKEKTRAEETLRVRTAELEREEDALTGQKMQLSLARDEIRRLEGQIALIEDLLLRQREV